MARVDATPSLEAIAMLKQEAIDAGYSTRDPRAGWFTRLTGEPIQRTAWERRFQTARKQGLIKADHQAEFLALVAAREPLQRRPALTRGPAPRLTSAPLRASFSDLPETLSVYRIDELCVRHLGVHPAELYGDLWWDAA